MTLKFVIGYSKDIFTAKERALYFYNEVEGRKKLEFIESQIGQNEIGDTAWFTTIWYSELPAQPESKEPEEKFEFIGSTGIDPTDPDWRIKWEQAHQPEDDTLAVQTTPTVDLQVNRVRCEECGMHHEPHTNSLCSK